MVKYDYHSDTILFYPFFAQDQQFQKGSGSNHPSSYGRRSLLQDLRYFVRDGHQGASTRIASVIHNVFCYYFTLTITSWHIDSSSFSTFS